MTKARKGSRTEKITHHRKEELIMGQLVGGAFDHSETLDVEEQRLSEQEERVLDEMGVE